MTWNRHRNEEKSEEIPEEKKSEEIAEEKKSEEIPEEKKSEEIAEEKKTEKIPEKKKAERIIKKKVVKKEILEDKKTYNNIAIMGSTIEVRDFRAIVKRKGENLNTVLAKLIGEYNKKNYNL